MARNIKATIATILLIPFFVWLSPKNNNIIEAKIFCGVILIGVLWVLMYLAFSSDKGRRGNGKMEI
jgi:hypothetical protein